MGITHTCLSWTNQSNDFFNYFIFEVDQCFQGKTSRLKIFCRCRIQKSQNILQKVITSAKVIINIRISLSDVQSELSGIYQKSGISLPPLLLSAHIVWLHWDCFRGKNRIAKQCKSYHSLIQHGHLGLTLFDGCQAELVLGIPFRSIVHCNLSISQTGNNGPPFRAAQSPAVCIFSYSSGSQQ